MGLSNYILNFNCNDKKIIYLIFFLPISLIVGSSVINITIFLIIFLFLYELYKKNRLNFILNKDFYILITIYFYIVINSIFINDYGNGIVPAIGLLRFIILSFALAYYLKIENNKYEKKIYSFWALVFIVVVFDIFFEYFFGHNILNFKSNYPGRLASFTGSELKIGGYCFGFFLLSLSFFYSFKKKIYYPLFILFLIATLLIGERSNFIKIFFISSIFLFFTYKGPIIKKIFLFFLGITIILLVFVNNKHLKIRFYNEIFFSIKDVGLINYLKTNKHGIHYVTSMEIIKQNKLFGVGFKNFRNESFKDKYNINNIRSGWAPHPHQIHFEILSELGITGYFLIILFFIYYIINGFIIYKKNSNLYILSSTLFILATILPLIPSGSFFTTFTASIFWINFSIILKNKMKNKF